jgi:hypothetical protein
MAGAFAYSSASLASTLSFILDDDDAKGVPTPLKRRPRSAFWAELNSREFTSDDMFRAEMRLPREVFAQVVQEIKGDIVFAKPGNIGSRGVSVEKQLACFLLRVGADTSCSIVGQRLWLSPSTVSESTRRVAIAIGRQLGDRLKMPKNGTAAKKAVEKHFSMRQFKGCVGIIDCTHISVVVDSGVVKKGEANVYVDRKGVKSLTFQAVTTCEDTPRFLNVSGGLPGSAYDTKILEKSRLYTSIGEYLEGEEYLAGDSGYPLRPWLVHGWKNSELKKIKNPHLVQRLQQFNKFYSGMRISVE